MAGRKDHIASMQKLDGQDWAKWERKMDILLHGLKTLVHGIRICTTVKEDTKPDEEKDLNKLKQYDAKFASFIVFSLSGNIAKLILIRRHSNEMWEKLLARFERSSCQRLSMFCKDFLSIMYI